MALDHYGRDRRRKAKYTRFIRAGKDYPGIVIRGIDKITRFICPDTPMDKNTFYRHVDNNGLPCWRDPKFGWCAIPKDLWQYFKKRRDEYLKSV